MSAEAILHAAREAIEDRSSVRDDDSGKSMSRTVDIFNKLSDGELSERDGWLFLACVKLGRSQQGAFCVDDYIDAAGYIALAGECAAGEVRPTRKGPSVGEDLREIHANGWLSPSPIVTNCGINPLGLSGMPGEKTK